MVSREINIKQWNCSSTHQPGNPFDLANKTSKAESRHTFFDCSQTYSPIHLLIKFSYGESRKYNTIIKVKAQVMAAPLQR